MISMNLDNSEVQRQEAFDFSLTLPTQRPITPTEKYNGYWVDEGRLHVVDHTGGRVIYSITRLNHQEAHVHGDHVHAADASIYQIKVDGHSIQRASESISSYSAFMESQSLVSRPYIGKVIKAS